VPEVIAGVVGALLTTGIEAMGIHGNIWPTVRMATGPARHSGPLQGSGLRVADLKSTVEFFVDAGLARRAYRRYEQARGVSLDDDAVAERGFVHVCECLLEEAVGSSTAQTILGAILRDRPAISAARLVLAEQAPPESPDRLRDGLECIDVGVALFDSGLDLVAWNHRALELLEIPGDLAVAPDFPATLGRILAERSGLGSSDVELAEEQQATTRSGVPCSQMTHLVSGRTVEARGRRMPDGGIAVTFNDVTERRRVDSELRKYRNHLECMVKERTVQLELLRQRAVDASLAKSALMANLSHEVRTPLNGILGFARILQTEEGLTQRHMDGLSMIRSCGEHLLALVNRTLDFSRKEAAQCMQLSPRRVDLQQFLRPVVESTRVQAEEKGLRFRHESLIQSSCWLLLDDVRLSQALFNLLGNAIKFTRAGEVVLRSQVIDLCPSRRRIAFEVVDTGPGIAATDVGRIFLPFEQLGDARAREEGSGLGLYISRQLVLLMGGDIRVASDIGQGSTFAFDLEVERADAD
jgi:signal transduction histidine kinase